MPQSLAASFGTYGIPPRPDISRSCRVLHQPAKVVAYNPLRRRRENQWAGMNGPA